MEVSFVSGVVFVDERGSFKRASHVLLEVVDQYLLLIFFVEEYLVIEHSFTF